MNVIIAAIPKILLSILGRIFTEAFMTQVLEKVVIYSLEKLASNTKSTIDDEIVANIKKQLEGNQ